MHQSNAKPLVIILLTLGVFAVTALIPKSPVVESQGNGTVAATVKLGGKAVAGVVVRIDGVPNSNPRLVGVTRNAVMSQTNSQFDPGVLAVPAGSKVTFPNNDRVFHNVFSLSKTKRFDLGLYKQGEGKEVTFNRAGVVDVYCNIHPEMVAKILVVDTVHYGTTDKSGSVKIDNVPAGSYRALAWHPKSNETAVAVTVRAGKTASIKFTVAKGGGSTKHSKKDGTPYGRYK